MWVLKGTNVTLEYKTFILSGPQRQNVYFSKPGQAVGIFLSFRPKTRTAHQTAITLDPDTVPETNIAPCDKASRSRRDKKGASEMDNVDSRNPSKHSLTINT